MFWWLWEVLNVCSSALELASDESQGPRGRASVFLDFLFTSHLILEPNYRGLLFSNSLPRVPHYTVFQLQTHCACCRDHHACKQTCISSYSSIYKFNFLHYGSAITSRFVNLRLVNTIHSLY